ncbi:MAG: aldehyde dehydrogenase EutE [Christensenellaceae bacterium]|nr:aldehyde dehydrogenase EutE [Christensenellaceae bacterium]
MSYTDEQIRSIIKTTVSKIIAQNGGAAAVAGSTGGWIFEDANDAVAAAKASQALLSKMTLEKRGQLIEAMRVAARKNARYLAELAHEETGYGHVEDKVIKNNLAANKTPGIEDLQPRAFTGDYGLTLVEMAPFGVIGSITPSTNPTATVINNSISMIAAGNAVVYNPHPAAKKSSQEAMRILNEAIVAAGGPPALITTVYKPTLESGKIIMEHKDIKILSITGGEAVVKTAMKVGKKVIAAGPGNPPVIVDDTALLKQAAKDIVDGASFDNNVLCIAEKELFAFDNIFDDLMREMEKNGAYRIFGADIDKVIKTALIEKDGKYVINRKYVGHDAALILKDAGVNFVGNPRLIIAEVDRNHPFVMVEMLMPVLGCVRVKNIEEAISEAVRAEQGCWHSAMIHSTNVKNMSAAAAALNTTIFVKNAPSYAALAVDGEGYTTLTIATPTGEGLTSARSFTRARRCTLKGDFHIV